MFCLNLYLNSNRNDDDEFASISSRTASAATISASSSTSSMSSGSKSMYSPYKNDAIGTNNNPVIKKVISTVHRTVTHINSENDGKTTTTITNRKAFLENRSPSKCASTTLIPNRSPSAYIEQPTKLSTNGEWSCDPANDTTSLSHGKYFRNIVSNCTERSKVLPDTELNVQITKAAPTKSVKLLNNLNVLKSKGFSVTVNVNGANDNAFD